MTAGNFRSTEALLTCIVKYCTRRFVLEPWVIAIGVEWVSSFWTKLTHHASSQARHSLGNIAWISLYSFLHKLKRHHANHYCVITFRYFFVFAHTICHIYSHIRSACSRVNEFEQQLTVAPTCVISYPFGKGLQVTHTHSLIFGSHHLLLSVAQQGTLKLEQSRQLLLDSMSSTKAYTNHGDAT